IVPAMGRLAEKIVVSPTPLPPTPTATPTLTPEQVAEIRKKQFEGLNQKYGPCRLVPILMYHHVMEVAAARKIGALSLNVPPEIFRQQMDFLQQKGYRVISLEEMLTGLKNNSLPSKPVVLTFDDGYRDFYENVYPILREKNFKATLFVISQYVGGERYVTWWQLREMAESGLVLLGDHTLNHPSLPSLNKDQEFNQIVSAKKIIEENTGVTVNFFAYPYGSANANARQVLKENGFLGAVTTIPGETQCLGLPYDWQRIRIGAASLSRYGF
ncbi:MAG: polysaccharide deacetylase family protein, partial [Microgenomates group bacterium]